MREKQVRGRSSAEGRRRFLDGAELRPRELNGVESRRKQNGEGRGNRRRFT